MKPTPKSPPDPAPLLAFGAHPDDIEFACGAVIALETRAGRPAHFVICSRGEAGTRGTPAQRAAEAKKAAALLGATVEFIQLDGDARLEMRAAHAIRLAGVIRRARLFFYAVPPEAEPSDITPVLMDVSAPEIIAAWTAAMEAHASQVRARPYVALQLARARFQGLRAGVGHAIALFPSDPLVAASLAQLSRGARRF